MCFTIAESGGRIFVKDQLLKIIPFVTFCSRLGLRGKGGEGEISEHH